MLLYNSATHKKEQFETHTPGHVEMYTCGPTVYHFAHIGNLRSYIMEDVLEKFLRYDGYEVNRVMNITDVGHLASDADTGEDKMLKGAKREHKSVMEIAQYYTDAFFEDCRKLNIKRPDTIQPATGCIEDYIKIISGLLDKGYAYLAGGNVYFDSSKLERYYVFNDHDEEDLAVGVREGVEEDTNKRNKNDFVLWFTKSKFEDQALKWDSPWGVGYPGWHIECSGISLKYNGEYLDLHCGGIDNAFPHHTNEIAQSESYLGHPWCKQWFHVHHLNTNSGKMSKSKGEFLTVSLLEEKGYDPLAYRFFCLQSHYRKGLVFSWENLDNAAGAYQKLIAKIAALDPKDGDVDEAVLAEYKDKFRQQVGNDLNTSMAVTALYDALKAKTNGATKLAILDSFDQVLSLSLLEKASKAREEQAKAKSAQSAGGYTITGEGDEAIDALVRQRYEAKKAKNSKSKGEFLTVSLLEEKGYDPLAYRFFCLQSHYRKGLVFSWENLDNAAGAYQKLIAKIAALDPKDGDVDEAVLAEYKDKFRQQVGNDLNTSMAVTALYDALKAKTNGATKLAILDSFDQVLSLSLLEKASKAREEQAKAKSAQSAGGYTITGEGDEAIDALVRQRYEAKKAKNFAEADRIRDELRQQGIEITDMPGGAAWKRV